jgi:hypothetical protein
MLNLTNFNQADLKAKLLRLNYVQPKKSLEDCKINSIGLKTS